MVAYLAQVLRVCGLSELSQHLKKMPQASVLSIENLPAHSGNDIGRAPRLRPHRQQKILQFMDSYSQDDPNKASLDDVLQGLNFCRAQIAAGKPLIIQCMLGQSRSAAMALAVIADCLGHGQESEAVNLLRQLRPAASPNKLMLVLIDQLLGSNGRLIQAVRDCIDPNQALAAQRAQMQCTDPARVEVKIRRPRRKLVNPADLANAAGLFELVAAR